MKTTTMKTATTKTTTTPYNIYPKTPGRKNTNPALALTMRAMNKGQYIFVESDYKTDVYSFQRSIVKKFSTKTMRDGKLKVLCISSR